MYDFIEAQLALWPEARERYHSLGKTERRRFRTGDFEGAVQFNPARIVSTGAKVDSRSIAERPCFLCRKNRPAEQLAIPILERWELLLNPYPIFPVHFTIAYLCHEPQEAPPADMAAIADMYPDLAIFFNGAKAGASAPDHLHLQAVLKSELPLIALAERLHPSSEKGIRHSSEFGADLPFDLYSAVIAPDRDGMINLQRMLRVTGHETPGDRPADAPGAGEERPDGGLRNVMVWKDDAGWLRVVVIPRRRHRPYVYGTEPGQFLVSPGTIDMAGIVVVPRREDFEALTDSDLRRIYKEVAL